MKEIKVFIASSNDELEERNAIKEVLLEINDVASEFGVTISPEMWELKSVEFQHGLERKQSEYNKSLISSDIAFFIFGKRVGKYTREEFEEAYKQVKNKNPLRMFAYFKNVDLGKMSVVNQSDVTGVSDIIELKDFIANTLEQVYGDFDTIVDLLPKLVREVLATVIPLLKEPVKLKPIINRLIELYSETDKSYKVEQRDAIIEYAVNSLFLLSKYNYTQKLDQANFYELCHSILKNAREDTDISALSLMLPSEWDNSIDEQNFWNDNQAAVKRQAKLERIFIVKKNEAHRLKSNPQIRNHVTLGEKQGISPYFRSYVVEKEILRNDYPELLSQAGNGFILINSQQDNIALLDEMPESKQRAKPITDPRHLKELSTTFEELKRLSTPLKIYLDTIAWSHYKKEMISIFVTTECNLNCDYCFTNKNQDEHKAQTISLDFVKKGIDDYFESEDTRGYMRHVRFFGAGEPTAKFNLLKDICEYARQKGGPSVTFEIQTNGAFSDATAKWMKENINIIWISCDGTPDIQDKHRPFKDNNRKSSAAIEKNIKILQEYNSKAFVGIRATITSENITRQHEMIDYFHGLGIRDIWVDPIFPSVGKEALCKENDFDTMLFAEEFLKATKYAKENDVFYGSILTCNFNDSVNKHCRTCIPVPHLTTDGFVSACDMALFGKDENHMSEMIYGSWNKETGEIKYDKNKIEHLQSRTTENMQHCEMCSAKECCGGYCLGEVLNETGDLFGQKKRVCQAIRYLDKHLAPELRQYKYTHP